MMEILKILVSSHDRSLRPNSTLEKAESMIGAYQTVCGKFDFLSKMLSVKLTS